MSDDWNIPSAYLATNHEIEGYASATSINRGESIQFYVNTASPTYDMYIYRMGWYGGHGGRLVQRMENMPGIQQPACPITDVVTKLRECDWANSYTLVVPNNTLDPTEWASGVYLVKLKAANNKQSYMIFTVRDDNRNADFLFQSAVTTYAAYNIWGGSNLYGTGGTPRAHKVSFNRPYARTSVLTNPAIGTGDFMEWELLMLRFVEREGYNVSYSTNIDTHTNGARLLSFKALLSVGHDEYWTKEMRNSFEAARNAGVHLGFFGANAAYWQIRFEPSSLGEPNRTIASYRDDTDTNDPIFQINPAESTFRFRQLSRPESALIGVQYDYNSVRSDMIVSDCSSWICAGTGLVTGDVLPGLLGYEVDGMNASSPAGTFAIMTSPYVCKSNFPGCSASPTQYSHMSFYTAPSGAMVFATGSMSWTYGLDAYGPNGRFVNLKAQQISRNVLNRFINPTPSAMTTEQADRLALADIKVSVPRVGGGCTFSGESNSGDISLLLLLLGNVVWWRKNRVQASRLANRHSEIVN